MAIADLFKKKKPEMGEAIPGAPPAPEVPVSEVMSMQSQGLTNNQIIQSLQRQGFNPTAIYDALAQAEAKKTIEPMQPPQMPERPMQKPKEDVESLVEQVVEEKWGEFQKELGKLNEWKGDVSSRVDKVEQSVVDLRSELESLHKAIVGRIGDYDKTLTDVGTEIKAMEKVFQKVLPELTSNVQELSRITKQSKK